METLMWRFVYCNVCCMFAKVIEGFFMKHKVKSRATYSISCKFFAAGWTLPGIRNEMLMPWSRFEVPEQERRMKTGQKLVSKSWLLAWLSGLIDWCFEVDLRSFGWNWREDSSQKTNESDASILKESDETWNEKLDILRPEKPATSQELWNCHLHLLTSEKNSMDLKFHPSCISMLLSKVDLNLFIFCPKTSVTSTTLTKNMMQKSLNICNSTTLWLWSNSRWTLNWKIQHSIKRVHCDGFIRFWLFVHRKMLVKMLMKMLIEDAGGCFKVVWKIKKKKILQETASSGASSVSQIYLRSCLGSRLFFRHEDTTLDSSGDLTFFGWCSWLKLEEFLLVSTSSVSRLKWSLFPFPSSREWNLMIYKNLSTNFSSINRTSKRFKAVSNSVAFRTSTSSIYP
jgi:hypothetical protein